MPTSVSQGLHKGSWLLDLYPTNSLLEVTVYPVLPPHPLRAQFHLSPPLQAVPMLPLKGASVPSVDTLPFPVSKVVDALSRIQLAGGPIFPHCVHLGSKDETFPGNPTSQCA